MSKEAIEASITQVVEIVCGDVVVQLLISTVGPLGVRARWPGIDQPVEGQIGRDTVRELLEKALAAIDTEPAAVRMRRLLRLRPHDGAAP